MEKLSRMMKWGALVGGLSLLGACGGSEQEAALEETQEQVAAMGACRTETRQFSYCVNEKNLVGLATCASTEYRESYTLSGACSTTSYHTITWVCCPR